MATGSVSNGSPGSASGGSRWEGGDDGLGLASWCRDEECGGGTSHFNMDFGGKSAVLRGQLAEHTVFCAPVRRAGARASRSMIGVKYVPVLGGDGPKIASPGDILDHLPREIS